jgi:adenosyl cobinamide kinase/adenosyl cobinamide phosphate guanylyltransferase
MATFSRRARLGRVVVLGGARSGKSAFAEKLGAEVDGITHVRPGPGTDDSDRLAEYERTRQRLPKDWTTVRTQDLTAILRASDGPVIIDSLTDWLTTALEDSGAWIDAPGWRGELDAAVGDLLQAWRTTTRSVVVVSDEVGGGPVPETVSARMFRDALAELNLQFAAQADTVWLITAGLPLRLK